MKQLIEIKFSQQYNKLVEHYNRKGCLTNNYLQYDVANLISRDILFAVCGEDNAVLLVQKDGFMRLYYYINNTKEIIDLPQGEYVTEVLFRGENMPEAEVIWLGEVGFKKNLIRDQYFAKYSSLTTPILNTGFKIETVVAMEDALWAVNLFNSSFDKWSGGFISNGQVSNMIQEQAILIARDWNGTRLGALHRGKEKGVSWLHHIAVAESARGHGIGTGLLEAFIDLGYTDDNSRYMLWVQRQNTPAVTLYKKKGFAPMGKSSLSMIKL